MSTKEVEWDGLPVPKRYWAILAIAMGITVSVLDGTIANVALPSIAEDLQATPSMSIWIVNAYQLAIVVSLLSLSSLGDILGYRRVYIGGLLIFSVTSLACALSNSLLTLTVARVFQGFGAAALAGRLIERVHAGVLGGVGLSIFSAGLFLLAVFANQVSNAGIALFMAMCGFGFGLFQTPNNSILISSAPQNRSGGASGMLGMARLTGQTTGASLVALMFVVFPVDGTYASLYFAGGFATLAAIVSFTRVSLPEPEMLMTTKKKKVV